MSEETRSIVPRKDGEAGIGREDKYWGKGYFNTVHAKDGITIKGKSLGDILTEKDKNLSDEITKVNKHFMTNDQSIKTNATNITANKDNITKVSQEVTSLKASVGSPLVASTFSAMTDTNKIYVYTGSESGYTNGNWYYYDGAKWTSGGIYNAIAFATDKTLSMAGKAADSKVCGEQISDIKEAIQILGIDGQIKVEGNDHNYYFGGGPNYANVVVSYLTFTKVFPIENGKKYQVINSGNTCVIGFANEEYKNSGTLSDNIVKSDYTFDVTNTKDYKFLYVFYSDNNKEKQGDCILKVYTDVVTKKLLNQKIAENVETLNDFIKSGFNKIDLKDENIHKGYFVNNDGRLVSNVTSDAHTDINVKRGYKVHVKNAYCRYNRSICAYTTDGKFVKVLATNMGDDVIDTEFDVDNYDKISVTSKLGEDITLEYVGIVPIETTDNLCKSVDKKNTLADGTGNYQLPNFVLNQKEFTDGYLAGASVLESTELYYSPYIPVYDEQTIRLKNAFVGGFTKAVFYDANKNYIGYAKSDDNYYSATYEVIIPYGTHYVRFNVRKATDFNIVEVEYTHKIERNYKPLNLINRWYTESSEKINQLFKKTTEKPICCIIDDDSLSTTDMETFATVMENNGVPGTVACLTSRMHTDANLKAKLQELERRGHQVVLHGYTQNEAYKTATDIGDSNYKIAEDDFVHGMQELINAGFINCKYWVTPFGVSRKCLQQLARKWGMECLVTTAKKEYNRTDGKFSRYEIQRSGLNPSDAGTLTQAELIALADECAKENGWLLVNTHIYEWKDGFTRINDFISHCKEKGFEFMTLGDAWKIRKPIYDWYDMF